MFTPKIEQQLTDFFKNYEYASAVVAYTEMKGLEYDYVAMAEFRDALTHLKRVFSETDETAAIVELNSAFEHVRRGAVESLQNHVETKFNDIRDRAYAPAPKYIISRCKRMDIEEFKQKEKDITTYIYEGRRAKPHQGWKEAISYFNKAEDILDELDSKLPTLEQLNSSFSENATSLLFLFLGLILGYAIF
jgi:hypothetical protein